MSRIKNKTIKKNNIKHNKKDSDNAFVESLANDITQEKEDKKEEKNQDTNDDNNDNTDEKKEEIDDDKEELEFQMELPVFEKVVAPEVEKREWKYGDPDLLEMKKPDIINDNDKELFKLTEKIASSNDDIQYVISLDKDKICDYIESHNLLKGRYIDDDDKICIASNAMFEFKKNFNKFDLMQDYISKKESQIYAENSLQKELIKSSFVSKSVQTKTSFFCFGSSFSWAKENSKNSSNKSFKQTISIIKYNNFIRAKINLNETIIDYTNSFLLDFKKQMQYRHKYKDDKNKLKEIWNEFREKYGDFFITNAYIGGKVFIENETNASSFEELKSEKKEEKNDNSYKFEFDGEKFGTLVGTAIGAKYGNPETGMQLEMYFGSDFKWV